MYIPKNPYIVPRIREQMKMGSDGKQVEANTTMFKGLHGAVVKADDEEYYYTQMGSRDYLKRNVDSKEELDDLMKLYYQVKLNDFMASGKIQPMDKASPYGNQVNFIQDTDTRNKYHLGLMMEDFKNREGREPTYKETRKMIKPYKQTGGLSAQELQKLQDPQTNLLKDVLRRQKLMEVELRRREKAGMGEYEVEADGGGKKLRLRPRSGSVGSPSFISTGLNKNQPKPTDLEDAMKDAVASPTISKPTVSKRGRGRGKRGGGLRGDGGEL